MDRQGQDWSSHDAWEKENTVSKASRLYWSGIFARLANYDIATGGGYDFQAVVKGHVNGAIGGPWTYEEYIEKWEEEHGVKMTQAQKDILALGCIGVVMLELGIDRNPSLLNGYKNFKDARNYAKELQDKIDANPGDYSKDGNLGRVVVYGFLFNDDNDVYKYDEEGRLSLTIGDFKEINDEAIRTGRSFDFGLYNHKNFTIIDANNNNIEANDMVIYERSIAEFETLKFDKRAYYVEITYVPKPK